LKFFFYFWFNCKRERLLKRFLDNYFKKNYKIKILDFGCGGGNELLKNYDTLGVDSSKKSLGNASKIYKNIKLIKPNKNLPFKDKFFDLIISLDVLGHLSCNEKEFYFREFYRVLKPGGLMFHMSELDSDIGLFKFAKKNRDLYKKYFTEKDGHIGLLNKKDLIILLTNNGFELKEYEANVGSFIWPIDEYIKRFNNEYKNNPRIRVLINFFVFLKNIKLYLVLDLFLSIISFAEIKIIRSGDSSGFFI